MDWFSVAIVSVGLFVLGVIVGIHVAPDEEDDEPFTGLKDDLIASLESEVARLTGELSQAKNTLSLVGREEHAGKGEPIKARTSAEVRKAVERRNLEERESHG